MNELRKLLKISEGDFDNLKNRPSVFFIMTPDRIKPHFFLHYVISKEIASLSNVGASVKVLILDNCAKILDSELEVRDIETFMRHMSDITRLVGGNMSEIKFILESTLIDEKKTTSNVLKLLSSLSMDEILHMLTKTNYGLGNGFFDAAAIASLPQDQAVDFVVMGEHEKIAEYLMKNKLHLLSKRSIKFIHSHSLYTVRDEKIFPYGIGGEELFMSDSQSVLAEKLHSATASDVKTAIKPFLLNFVDDWLAKILLTEENYLAWKHIKRCDSEKIKRIFLEYITHFSQYFAAACAKSTDKVRITDLTSEGSSTIFAALSNELRIAILLELEHRPLSLSEIFLAIKMRTKNNRLTAAHIFPHLKKLMNAGLVRKENDKYVTTFCNLSLFIR